MKSVDNVAEVHHVHVWELDEVHRAFEAHVVTASDNAADWERAKKHIKQILADEFQIEHSTLEFESATESREHDRSRIVEP